MTTERVSVKLKRESWENIFRVLEWCAPMELSSSEERSYLKVTGEHWSLGNFWAAIHEAQRQVEEAK